MNKWLFPPLIAGLALTGSGFLRALEDTTRQSAALARAARSAPATTRAAAADVADLPRAARLTEAQADTFEALVDALDVSARRVAALNATVSRQARALENLAQRLDSLRPTVRCARRRLGALLEATALSPRRLAAIAAHLQDVIASQQRALGHLISINTKLAVLGLAADLLGVEPAPPPKSDAHRPRPASPLAPRPCGARPTA